MAWAPPQKVGDKDPSVAAAKKVLGRFSYGQGLGSTDEYTAEFGEALQHFQNNVHSLVATGRRRGPDVGVLGVLDWATKTQLGLLAPPPPTVPARKIVSFTGTWGAWDNGFGYDVGVRVDQGKYQHQGLGYNTNAFMIGNDPGHSYIDMLNDGEAEYLRMFRDDRRPTVLAGYSGGANCVAQVLNHWPADRRSEIIGVVQFGDPSRPPGKTLLGNDPGGHGISEDFPPDWVLDRYYSFTIDGDMYPNAVGLLPVFYDILTRMEATAEFAMYLFNLFINTATGAFSSIGLQALGLGGNSSIPFFGQLSGLLPLLTGGLGGGQQGNQPVNLLSMILNIGNIISSLMALLKFMTTNAHSHYGDQPIFGGLTGVSRAVQIVNAL